VTTVLLLLICLFGIVLVLLFGAVVEMYGQLNQIRDHLDMHDNPSPLELGESQDIRPSSIGLPDGLDGAEEAIVLFLSNKCQTCHQIAATLNPGALPPSLWLVIVPVSGDIQEFIDQFQLRGDRIVLDEEEQIVSRLGLDITPATVVVKNGRLDHAQTVPTTRQLFTMLAGPKPRDVLVPKTGVSPVKNSKAKAQPTP
jgi:hypothetical protein